MDGKVILTFFGVILLLAAVFFFFKSFASHEQRMQDEQRMRVELERKKLEVDRAAANRPLTPEDAEQRRRLAEARLQADQARRAASELARKEAETQRLRSQIDQTRRTADEEKRRLQDVRLSGELWLQQMQGAAKQTEETKKKDAEAVQGQRNELLKSCGEILVSVERTSKAIQSALASSEDVAENLDAQRRAARTRLEVMMRQVAVRQQFLAAIPSDWRWTCPNPTCGKYPAENVVPGRGPSGALNSGTRTWSGSTFSSTSSSAPSSEPGNARCPYCKGWLQQKDFADQHRAVATDDLNKARQNLAVEQERERKIPATTGQDDQYKYQAQKATLENVRLAVLGIKLKLEGEAPGIDLLSQELTSCKMTVEGVLALLPRDLMRIAQAPVVAIGNDTPVAPRKVYKMRDGRRLEVVSEMVSGDEVIIKGTDGEMVTVKKADIEASVPGAK